ncbi:MAG: peptidoglycan DD-metalloendopeptidase family protein [Magnetococcales bacterium]|nr:peptidoglycan DD-metalloendopeptidase family protein [Magnetococcales bacterium]
MASSAQRKQKGLWSLGGLSVLLLLTQQGTAANTATPEPGSNKAELRIPSPPPLPRIPAMQLKHSRTVSQDDDTDDADLTQSGVKKETSPIRSAQNKDDADGVPTPVPAPRSARSETPAAAKKADGGEERASSFFSDILPVREATETVRKGDTLHTLLKRHNVPTRRILATEKASKEVFDLAKKLTPGLTLKLAFDKSDNLVALVAPVAENKTLQLIAQSSKDPRFVAGFVATPFERIALAPVALPASESKTPERVVAEKSEKSTISPQARKYFDKSAHVIEEKVLSGDYLTRVLARRQVPSTVAVEVGKAAKPVFDLAEQLKVGNIMRLAFDRKGDLAGLSYPIGDDKVLWVTRNTSGNYVPRVEMKSFDIKVNAISGIINDSLFTAARKSGLSQQLTVKLAEMFEYDVDFARDIHAGDRFTVVYEELFSEGKMVRTGEILAAEFINQGNVLKSVRYTDPEGRSGYFNANGDNVRKMFIRAPVDFTRISSYFSNSRLHPVFGFNRAHKGVDYAAPTGTPVRAAGNGTVVYVGPKGGYGNLIMVRHNDTYSTAYAHLSRVASNVDVGSYVRQGKVIGYVGMTGTATGPHLHYEVHINGQQVNPLSAQLPTAKGVAPKFIADFKARSEPLLVLLDNSAKTFMAANTHRK